MPYFGEENCCPERFALALEDWTAFVSAALLRRNVELAETRDVLSLELALYLRALKWAREALDFAAPFGAPCGGDRRGQIADDMENLHYDEAGDPRHPEGPGIRLLDALAEAFFAESPGRGGTCVMGATHFKQLALFANTYVIGATDFKQLALAAVRQFQKDYLAVLSSELQGWREGKWKDVATKWEYSVSTYFRRFIDVGASELLDQGEEELHEECDEVGWRRRLAGEHEENDEWRRRLAGADEDADDGTLELPWDPWPWCPGGDLCWDEAFHEDMLPPASLADDLYSGGIYESMLIPSSLIFGPLFDLLTLKLEWEAEELEETLVLSAPTRGVFNDAIREVRAFAETPWRHGVFALKDRERNPNEKAQQQRFVLLDMLDHLEFFDDEREDRAFVVSKLLESTARICAAVRAEANSTPPKHSPAENAPVAPPQPVADVSAHEPAPPAMAESEPPALPDADAPPDVRSFDPATPPAPLPTDYMPGKDCRTASVRSPKRLLSTLKKNADIRRKYHGKHLFVHAGDWERFKREEESKLADDPKVWQAVAEDLGARYEKMRAKKEAPKPKVD